MRYCPRCVLPDTRPNLVFDDAGNCNCGTKESKKTIDWAARESDFRSIVERAKISKTSYDCIIPVSGGKDSHWQVLKCLEYGLKPLCVTYRTPVRTQIGIDNLNNLISLGVDHIDYQISPETEKKFLLKAFEKTGMAALPMHMAIHAIPTRLAVSFGIKLIIWGENPVLEYGGEESLRHGTRLTRDVFMSHGVTGGTFAEDWADEDLSLKELAPYIMPDEAELNANEVYAIFLGSYFPWDPVEVYERVKKFGFQAREEGPRVGLYNFADIDDDCIISIHHYLKWHKFGFTRLFDNLSIEVRAGRMSRNEAIEVIRREGDVAPHDDIERFCALLGITRERFEEIVDQFRNPDVWTKKDGRWVIEDFLVEDWNWQ